MKSQLITDFSTLNEPQFLLQVETISVALPSNAFFPLPWPAQVLAPPAMGLKVAAYQLAYNKAKDGDRTQIKARVTARILLTGEFQTVAHYLQIVSNGDASMLATTGFPLRQIGVKSISTNPLGAPLDLAVTRTALPGGLHVHARSLLRAYVYNLEIATGDPSVEANWSDAGIYPHCNHITLTGLTAGKTYYVRLRGFNRNGHGVWATSPGILVL